MQGHGGHQPGEGSGPQGLVLLVGDPEREGRVETGDGSGPAPDARS